MARSAAIAATCKERRDVDRHRHLTILVDDLVSCCHNASIALAGEPLVNDCGAVVYPVAGFDRSGKLDSPLKRTEERPLNVLIHPQPMHRSKEQRQRVAEGRDDIIERRLS